MNGKSEAIDFKKLAEGVFPGDAVPTNTCEAVEKALRSVAEQVGKERDAYREVAIILAKHINAQTTLDHEPEDKVVDAEAQRLYSKASAGEGTEQASENSKGTGGKK